MFGSVSVSEDHVDLFQRASALLSRMDNQPTVLSVTAAFLESRDRVKELEEQVAKLTQVN